MKRYTIRVLQGLGVLVLILLVYIGGVLAFGTASDWQPEAEEPVKTARRAKAKTVPDSTLSFVIWNIGYGGLGEESNFFYDEGTPLSSGDKMVRAPQELVQKNVEGITGFVARTKADFFLFQEVDYASKRSYYTNQFEQVSKQLPGFYAGFAANYQVSYVPIPLLEPWRAYGATYSGLATYARFQPDTSIRFQLPGSFDWPTRIFQLDRCVALHRYPVANGKELVVINLHLSAYDADGSLKRQQMGFLRELCLREYENGNYVVAGGDWNLVPPYFEFDSFMPGRTQGYFQYGIEADFLPADWLWVYDPRVPSNRKIRDTYQVGTTFITLIDFYLVSPNLKVKMVKGLNLDFQFSDHQPVYMEVELK